MAALPSSGPTRRRSGPRICRTSGMGSAYGFGGIGKIIGPGRAGPDRRLQQLSQARRAAAADSDGLPLSRLLVPDGRGGLLLPRHRDHAASRSSRSTGSCWRRPTCRVRSADRPRVRPGRDGRDICRTCRRPERDRPRRGCPPLRSRRPQARSRRRAGYPPALLRPSARGRAVLPAVADADLTFV